MSRRDKHAPNTLDNYLMLHEKHLREHEHFIVENRLGSFEFGESNQLTFSGLVFCQGYTYLKVEKTAQILTNGWVETIDYAYHGGVSYPESHAIFRFDNAHGIHEQHLFDPVTGEELGHPRILTRNEWPHLSECLDMLEVWCYTFGSCRESDPRRG